MAFGKKLRVTFNSPCVLGFAFLCCAVHIMNIITGGGSNHLLFSVYRSSLLNPLTYLRFFLHILGHSNWSHLLSNMMYILLLGPMLEEKYGSTRLILMFLCTAFCTGLVQFIFFPTTALMGASGVVFAMILLSSITSTEEGTIPVSFILVAVLYLGQQIAEGIANKDHISQLSHIIGGIVGSAAGFLMNRSGLR